MSHALELEHYTHRAFILAITQELEFTFREVSSSIGSSLASAPVREELDAQVKRKEQSQEDGSDDDIVE